MLCKIESPRIALLLLTFFAFTSGFLNAYLGSMITTLEKRFDWPTVQIGWLISAGEIGYLLTVMCVAYYGGKGRQAMVLSSSAFGQFISVAVFIVPFFIWGPKYTPEQIRSNSSISESDNGGNQTSVSFSTESTVAFAIQFLSGLLYGCSATPFWNVGMSLIDDMSGRNSGLFLGFLFLIRTLSPICGFVFGGFMTSINEGLVLTADDFNQGTKDSRWIGAWWLGYLLLGILVVINFPFLALLDVEKLRAAGQNDLDELTASRKEKNRQALTAMMGSITTLNDHNLQQGPGAIDFKKTSISEFLIETKRLFTNSVFWLLYLGTVCEISAFMVLLTYFPKYIESHFHVDAKSANWMSSLSLAGGTAIAMLVSSVISKLWPMTMSEMNLFHAVSAIIAAVIFPILFAFKCDSVNLIGGHKEATPAFISNYSCFDWSSCSTNVYNPVCVEGINFMSPCYAGCTSVNKSYAVNCLCSDKTTSNTLCTPSCNNVYGYLVIFFITRVVSSMATVQFTQTIMRLPEKRDFKPLAISCMSILWGVLGVGTPPLAGKIIDTVCTIKNPITGFCLFYDTDRFRILIHGIGTVCQVPACIFFTLSWWFSRTRYPDAKDPVYKNRSMKKLKAQYQEESLRMTATDNEIS